MRTISARFLALAPILSIFVVACSGKSPAGSDAGALTEGQASAVSAEGSDARFQWTPETVLDRVSGLTWQRRVDPAHQTWSEAALRCQQLAPTGAWRLPTREELLTILSDDAEPAVLGDNAGWYWSATRSENLTEAAWAVGIARYTNAHAIDTEGLVRCVR